MYEVLNDFIEKNHENHLYKTGDTYPADGFKLVKRRANELTKVHKKYGIIFLKEVEQNDATTATSPVEESTEGEA